MADSILSVWINPLQMLEIDEPWASALPDQELTGESFLAFFCVPNAAPEISQLRDRYREISIEKPRLFAMPAEQGLLSRFLWPLRHAKGAYVVGNYLATVSLSGFVAEMAAILYFRLAVDDGVRVTQSIEGFEALDQSRRVDLLKQLKLLDVDERQAFGRIRAARKGYLHYWTQNDADLRQTAKQAYVDAAYLVHKVLGLGMKDGKLQLKPSVFRYLEKAGVALEAAQSGNPPGEQDGNQPPG